MNNYLEKKLDIEQIDVSRVKIAKIIDVKLIYNNKKTKLSILFQIIYGTNFCKCIEINYDFNEKIYIDKDISWFGLKYLKNGDNDINDIINWYFKNYHIGLPPRFDKCKSLGEFVEKNSWLKKMIGGRALLTKNSSNEWEVLTPFVCE